MGLGPRLVIKQSQSLTLTPQLMQSIKLLQLGHLELAAFVNEELERNPLLEANEKNETVLDIDSATLENKEEGFNEQPTQSNFEETQTIGSAADIANVYDTDVANIFPEQVGQDSISQSTNQLSSNSVGAKNNHHSGSQIADIDSYVAKKATLSEHLSAQISLMGFDQKQLIIAHHLVNNLDEKGYLDSSCADIASLLICNEQEVIEVQKKLQTCDPLGVFASDLQECMAIQLKELDRFDPIMEKLLDNLSLAASHDFVMLEKIVGADREDINDMLQELRQLDPKPALAFDGAPMQAVVADVFVRRGNDGAWHVELNSDILPRVLVNRTYYASVSKKLRQPAEKSFLVDCLQTANWLTKSLDQRAQTILKVATEIVRVQDGFLQNGISHLKPMTLKMVADAIEMHESTVSRVTANKYISTAGGLFEMKFFFTAALSSNIGGEEHSAASVRHAIKKMIDDEQATAILSDDKIAEMLQNNLGVDIARRTVAKYREAMDIPSSIIRRRIKKRREE